QADLPHRAIDDERQMTTGHVFIATSLDGFIARPDGGIDWLDSATETIEDHGYDAFIETMDGIIMGRETFELALTFQPWPYDKPMIVLSTRLQLADLPARLSGMLSVARSVPEAQARAAGMGWARAYVDGGATIQSFLRAGAISDM